jgi:hypothetical protein
MGLTLNSDLESEAKLATYFQAISAAFERCVIYPSVDILLT